MRVSVVGLGKLGAPLAAVVANKKHTVVGLDADERVVMAMNDRHPLVQETGLEFLLGQAVDLRATTDFGQVAHTDITQIIVPTPSGSDGRFINDHVIDVIHKLGPTIAAKDSRHVVVVCSTVMPGSCDGPIRAALEQASGRRVGQDVGLCYSPEFIALGSVINDLQNPDMVLIGESDVTSGELLAELMQTVAPGRPILRMNLVNAELAKLSVNAFVTMKISFANTLAELCEELAGADARTVAKAVGTDRRVGERYLRPATAYGGPCFPRDTVAFAALGREVGVDTWLAAATERINRHQLERVMQRVLVDSGAEAIGILGLSYKSATPVTDEAVGTMLMAAAASLGIRVVVHDPLVRVQRSELVDQADTVAGVFAECQNVVITVPFPYDVLRAEECQVSCDHRIHDLWGVLKPTAWPCKVIQTGVGP